jgi:hypothetical protein
MERGARQLYVFSPTTVETTCRNVTAFTYKELKERRGQLGIGELDFVITVASLEHVGLGRYGDAIAPFGDLAWLERLRCLLKPGGVLYLRAPTSTVDCVVFNAYRTFGPIRLAYIQRTWRLLAQYGEIANGTCSFDREPITVLRKPGAADVEADKSTNDMREALAAAQQLAVEANERADAVTVSVNVCAVRSIMGWCML